MDEIKVRDTFSLNMEDTVPIIQLYQKQAIRVLIDTGATIPVWVDTEKVITKVIKGAYDSHRTHELGGFGSNIKVPVPLYTVPRFQFKNVQFLDLDICISPKKLGDISLVLPASLFKYANTHIYRADSDTRISFEFTKNKYYWKYLGDSGGYAYTQDFEESDADDRLYNSAPSLWKENFTREEVIAKMKG